MGPVLLPVTDAKGRALLLAWDQDGLGGERHITYCSTYCSPISASGVDALPEGRIFVSSWQPCLGLMDARGEPIWTAASPILDFRDQTNPMRVSEDGKVVDFGYQGSAGPALRFDARSLALSGPGLDDGLTFATNRAGLRIDGWRAGTSPTLGGRKLSLEPYDVARSLAVAGNAKRFFLGSNFALTAFDDTGMQKWRSRSRSEVWAVNASKDGRIVVAAYSDGAIRWHRAEDGRELLALQVLPNGKEPARWDWVLWTPICESTHFGP